MTLPMFLGHALVSGAVFAVLILMGLVLGLMLVASVAELWSGVQDRLRDRDRLRYPRRGSETSLARWRRCKRAWQQLRQSILR